MKFKLLIFISLLSLCLPSFAAQKTTTTLHWKGITPSIIPGDSVILTGPNGIIPYADSAGLKVKDTTGVFTSDNITLELHYRMCNNGDSGGNCAQQGWVTDETSMAVGDLINETSWTVNTLETVIGTEQTVWPATWTTILINGAELPVNQPIIVPSGSVVFSTENKMPMGHMLAAGQNIEVHSVISSSKSI